MTVRSSCARSCPAARIEATAWPWRSWRGCPNRSIARARQIMARLEVDDQVTRAPSARAYWISVEVTNERQVGFDDDSPDGAGARKSRALDVVSMTPIEALNKLFELKEKARRI